jgi:hypothetical protein
MNEQLSGLHSRVLDLELSLRAIKARLDVIESRLAVSSSQTSAGSGYQDGSAPDSHVELAGESPAASAEGRGAGFESGSDLAAILSLIGRTFVALGGAYLLRALTDSQLLAQPVGVALGLAYAIGWLGLADHEGAAARQASAAFHAFVAAIIAFPLLWETVTRFRLLSTDTSALAVALVTTIGLAVAVRRRLQPVAWISVLGALVTILALISSTGSVVPFAMVAILLGVATLWLGYSLEWVFLRWPAALVADMTVLALAARVSNRSWPDPPSRIIALQLLLLTTYVTSIAIRTLIRRRDVIPFEVVQAFAALGIGFGGAVYVAHGTGSGATSLAAINLVFGMGAYGVALVFVERTGRRGNFYFYTSLGLVLVLVSVNLLLDGAPLALTCGGLSIVAAALARRVGRVTFTMHAAAYLFAGAAASGLLTAATDALIGPIPGQWTLFSPTSVALVAAAFACWLILPGAGCSASSYAWLPRLPIAALTAWSAAGCTVALVGSLAGTSGGAPPNAGTIATIRTMVLSAAALGLAWAGRHDRFRESSWLLYPVLVAGGLKLLIEDMARSKPATLFLALACYGGALIIASRLNRRESLIPRQASPAHR